MDVAEEIPPDVSPSISSSFILREFLEVGISLEEIPFHIGARSSLTTRTSVYSLLSPFIE